MKKILFISEGSIANNYSGGAITAQNIIRSLYQKYEITSVSLLVNSKRINVNKNKLLKNKKINFKFFYKKIKKENFLKKIISIFFLNEKNIFFGHSFNQEIKQIILTKKFDLIICYHWEAIAACSQIKGIKKIALYGDPLHQVIRSRLDFSDNIIIKCFGYLKIERVARISANLLSNFDKNFAFSKGHSRDFLKYNIKYGYIQTPIENKKKLKLINNDTIRILHLGHLGGTTSINSFKYMLFNFIPELIKILGNRKIEINVVGPYSKNMLDAFPQIKNEISKYKFIRFVGPVFPVEKAFLKNDLLLVCNEISLGVRIRILTAFSFGFPVVTNKSNKFGIPEIKNLNNCLVGNNAKELAKKCLLIKKNPKISKIISKNSIELQKKKFSFSNFESFVNTFF